MQPNESDSIIKAFTASFRKARIQAGRTWHRDNVAAVFMNYEDRHYLQAQAGREHGPLRVWTDLAPVIVNKKAYQPIGTLFGAPLVEDPDCGPPKALIIGDGYSTPNSGWIGEMDAGDEDASAPQPTWHDAEWMTLDLPGRPGAT